MKTTNTCTSCYGQLGHPESEVVIRPAAGTYRGLTPICPACYYIFSKQGAGPVKYIGFTRENLSQNPSREMLRQIGQ